MFRKIVVVFFLAIFCLTSCKHKIVQQLPSNFVEVPIPEYESDDWRQLNYTQNEIVVENHNGQAIIKLLDKNQVKGDTCRLIVPDGILLGVDHGEWGGSLTYVPNKKDATQTKIVDGNIHSIFYFQDKIYFTEGLAHLMESQGGLYLLESNDDKFIPHLIANLEDEPEAISVCHDKIIIATFENLYIIRDAKKELIFSKTFWNSLYPNSIAYIDDQNIFIGMRGGYAKINLINKKLRFFKYIR